MELKYPRPLEWWYGLCQRGARLRECLRRWRPAELVGPLYFYDLVRLARSGRGILLRCFYASTLLGVLCLTYANHFPAGDLWRLQGTSALHTSFTRKQVSDFSHSFVLAVLLSQSAAVLFITPVYLAGAIAEEKERQTLALLFLSHLSDREIILSKLCSRLTHLGSLLLTGLPIVLTVNWMIGGGLALLLSGFIVTFVALFSAGSISMLCSVLCRNAMSALLCSYGCLLTFNLLWIVPCAGFASSPVAFVLVMDERLDELSAPVASGSRQPTLTGKTIFPLRPPPPPTPQALAVEILPMTFVYVLLHGLIALFCIRESIRCLRVPEPDHVFNTPTATPRLVPVSTAFDLPDKPMPYRDRAGRKMSLLPPPRGDPLLWKEMVHDPPVKAPSAAVFLRAIAIWVLIFSGVFWLWLLGYWWFLKEGVDPPSITANLLLRVLGMTTAFIWCSGTAFRAASSLGRERQRGTLGMLLTLPVERTIILRAKWLGGILRLRTLGFLLLGIGSLGLLTGAFHPLAVLLLAGSCLALLDLLASLGVWFALVCPKTRTAQLCMAVLLLGLFAGPWLQLLNFHIPFSTDATDLWGHLWQIGINPFAAWWVSGFSGTEWREGLADPDGLFAARLFAVLQGIALMGTLAGIFWLAARRRLNLEPRD